MTLSLSKESLFSVIIKNQRFLCNSYGVNSSKVIGELRTKNPNIDQYEYKYDGNPDDFKPISDYFNFRDIRITPRNWKSISIIAEDLQIDKILSYISEYNEKLKLSTQESEAYDEVFQNLFQIEKIGIDSVKKSILESIWVHSEENIRELVAIILYVISMRLGVQNKIIELIISLHKSAQKDNDLNLLVPILCAQLKDMFYQSVYTCLFIYKMTNQGFISITEIIDIICQEDSYLTNSMYFYSSFEKSFHRNIVFVFTPELIEMKNISTSRLFSCLYQTDTSIMEQLISYPIKKIKEMRDLEEPYDDVTKAIMHDDVDTLQSIHTKSGKDINKYRIPYNIFDPFNNEVPLNYINFACQCGSIKCFKYLLLNHADIDSLTFSYAVLGNNTEIIHIIDQKINENKGIKRIVIREDCILKDPIKLSILYHQYDIFDWLLEKNTNIEKYTEYANFAIKHGNINAFLGLVDKGLVINEILYTKPFEISFSKGFYRPAKIILNNYSNEELFNNYDTNKLAPIKTGNLSIFKFCFPEKNPRKDYYDVLQYSIKHNYYSIFKYIINNLYQLDRSYEIQSLIKLSIQSNSLEIFNFFKDHINQRNFESLFDTGFSKKSLDICKYLTDLGLERHYEIDFFYYFLKAKSTNFQGYYDYFNSKIMHMNFNEIAKYYLRMDKNLNSIIYKMISERKEEDKEFFISYIFNESIKKGDKEMAKFLIKYKPVINNQSISYALKSNDIELVDIVLSFKINPIYISLYLDIAVTNQNLQIVKRLLSIPGINPNLYNKDGYTPLIIAIKKFNYEIITAFLDFYGNEIQSQISQVNNAFKILMDQILPKNEIHFFDVIKRLIKVENIDLNFYKYGKTFLIDAVSKNNSELVQLLLDSDKVDVNACDLKNNNTPLIISVLNRNITITKQLINYPKTNINFVKHDLQTVLTLAVEMKQIEIIKLLIKLERFDPVLNDINYAFFISDDQISQLLYQIKELDVNCSICRSNSSTLTFESALEYAIKNNQIEKIKIIVNHPTFDPVKSNVKKLVFHDFVTSNIQIFNLLIQKLNNDVNLHLPNGDSLFVIAANKCNENLLNEILNNPKFKPTKEEFCSVFIMIKSNPKLTKIKDKLINYDKMHNKYLNSNIISSSNEKLIQQKNQTIKTFYQRNMQTIQNSPLLLIKPRTTTEKNEVAPHMPLQPKESNPRIVQRSNEASNKTQEKNSVSMHSIKQSTSSSNKVQNNAVSKKDVAKENQNASLKSSNITENTKPISPPAVAKPTKGTQASIIPNTTDKQNKPNTAIVSQQIQVPKQNQKDLPKLNKQNEHITSTQKPEKKKFIIVVEKKK